VVVCDGFVGNVLLKFYESIAPTLMGVFARALHAERETLAEAFRELDYSEHGGAPLLGVRGVSIISHGKSQPRAIKNAIKVAVRAVESRMSDHIGGRLAAAATAAASAAAAGDGAPPARREAPACVTRGARGAAAPAFRRFAPPPGAGMLRRPPRPHAPRARAQPPSAGSPVKRPVAYFAGTGRAAPATVLTNHDFASRGIETTHEWIVERTGITSAASPRRARPRRRSRRTRRAARCSGPGSPPATSTPSC
jgi:hypothetical protein